MLGRVVQTDQRPPMFTPSVPNVFNVGAGAAGWIDTDVSAVTGTDVDKIWIVTSFCAGYAFQVQGARPHGSGVDTSISSGITVNFGQVGATGHMDLYRGALDCLYYIQGYVK